MLRATPGAEVEVIEYLKHPPSRETLRSLYDRAGMTPRDGLRTKGGQAQALGLLDADGDVVLNAMANEPSLIERPLVETEKGVRLCRPVERLNEIL